MASVLVKARAFVGPTCTGRITDMSQRMQAGRGIGHNREKRPVHNRHADLFKLGRGSDQCYLGSLMLK